MNHLVLLVFAVALWSPALCYYNYHTQLPNGQHVPHPCKPNYIWHGVGHINPLGGANRNQFGQDFARLGHKWSRELCQLDSDNDGLTNGQELGDPQCVWSQGQIPATSDNVTHPGVCDPWGSPQCASANTWVTCDVGEFQCDAINEPDVRNITLRYPRTLVPAKETTYVCFMFDIPADEEYHMVAFKPYIDNPNVMHHAVIYKCDSTSTLLDRPQLCNMGGIGCNGVVGIWSLGMTGDCLHPSVGFRIGKGAASRIALQFHWTNKQLVDNYYDSSGVMLYYTPRLRPNDAGLLITGQLDLIIPPGQPSRTLTGICPSSCTQRYINGSVNIITGFNHMHYLGIRGKVEQIRNGLVIRNVTNDDPYNYDNPHTWRYTDPVVVKQGDELKLTCEFSSLSKDRTTYFGAGSNDEMCYGIFTIYPSSNALIPGICGQWRDLHLCHLRDGPCNMSEFVNTSSPFTKSILDKVMSSCRYGSCQPECPQAIAEVKQSTACLQGQMWDYLKDQAVKNTQNPDAKMLQLIALIDSCDRQTVQSVMTTPVTEGDPSSGQKQNAAGTFLLLMIIALNALQING